jgi:hypothetical protein
MALGTDEIIQIVKAIINSNVATALPIPPPLILAGGSSRSGVSARTIAKEIIIRQQDAGVPLGNLPDGSENKSEKMERIRVEVMLKHLLENAKFTVVVNAGIPVSATGVCPAGSVVVQGSTISYGSGTAIMQ